MNTTASERFWLHVEVKSASECWPFKGYIGRNRYGNFKVNGKTVKAHRFAYEDRVEKIPGGMIVLHKCNNPACCNPSHLTSGTISENMRHASASGAFAVGKTGIRGVNFSPARQSWRARGSINGAQIVLYQGRSKEKAIAARRLWEEQYGISF